MTLSYSLLKSHSIEGFVIRVPSALSGAGRHSWKARESSRRILRWHKARQKPPVSLKMSAIAVLDKNQPETSKPRKSTTRSKAQLHVRRAEAYWVIPGKVIKMLPEHQEPHCTDYAEAATDLPPIELPGLKVIGIPQSGLVQISVADFARDNPLGAILRR